MYENHKTVNLTSTNLQMKKQKTELDVCKAMINRSDSNASGQSYNNCIDWTVQKSDWKDIMGSGLHNIFYFAGREDKVTGIPLKYVRIVQLFGLSTSLNVAIETEN